MLETGVPAETYEHVIRERSAWRRRAIVCSAILGVFLILATFMGCRAYFTPAHLSVAVAVPLECRTSDDGTQVFATVRLAALTDSYLTDVMSSDDEGQEVAAAVVVGGLVDLAELTDAQVHQLVADSRHALPVTFGVAGEEDGILIAVVDFPDDASDGRIDGLLLRGSHGEIANEQAVPLGIRYGSSGCEMAVSRPYEGY